LGGGACSYQRPFVANIVVIYPASGNQPKILAK
jgi:hypothetical protein